MSDGRLMIGVQGLTLDADEADRLQHPAVGGVILFARNYADPAQLLALTAAIRAVREPPLLIGVDHEGGRVQRFRRGFTVLPPAAAFGRVYDAEPQRALQLAETSGWLLATELLAAGIDLSFGPVLDVDGGVSAIIGDRAFHRRAEVVAQLAGAVHRGMRRAGMAAVGKHFPGHGGIAADSHLQLPVDPRPYATLREHDLQPFRALIDAGLQAVMPAHVSYPDVDARPGGFSPRWLRDILRDELGFDGAVISDDLGMAGAAGEGDYPTRCRAAIAAGCDMVLMCNDPAAVEQVMAAGDWRLDATGRRRVAALRGQSVLDWAGLHNRDDVITARRQLAPLVGTDDTSLGDNMVAE